MSKNLQQGNVLIVVLVVALLVAVGFGAYHFGKSGDLKVNPSIPTEELVPSPTSAPDETAYWNTYKGETAYTSDGSSSFSIKYPSNWELAPKDETVCCGMLYPEGKGEDPGLTPRIVLGAGGRGMGDTQAEEKTFPAGNSLYWRIVGQDGRVLAVASFPIGDIAYIFDAQNLTLEQEQLFLKMLETLTIHKP